MRSPVTSRHQESTNNLMPSAELEQLVDEPTYCRIRRCSRATARRERLAGNGCPFIRIGPRSIRYRPSDIAAFITQNRHTGEALGA
jgi:hypothetical protein